MLLDRENAVVVGRRVDALLWKKERRTPRAPSGCRHGVRPSLSSVVDRGALVDRLRELPDRVDRAVAEGICRGDVIALPEWYLIFTRSMSLLSPRATLPAGATRN
jgi:hypothetical protein